MSFTFVSLTKEKYSLGQSIRTLGVLTNQPCISNKVWGDLSYVLRITWGIERYYLFIYLFIIYLVDREEKPVQNCYLNLSLSFFFRTYKWIIIKPYNKPERKDYHPHFTKWESKTLSHFTHHLGRLTWPGCWIPFIIPNLYVCLSSQIMSHLKLGILVPYISKSD